MRQPEEPCEQKSGVSRQEQRTAGDRRSVRTIRRLDEHSIDGRETIDKAVAYLHLLMRSPLPTNRLVSLTLAGAVLTAFVALALAAPGLGLGVDSLTDDENPTVASDAPTPNEDFTPAVGTQGGGEHEDDEYEDEYEEYEEEEDD